MSLVPDLLSVCAIKQTLSPVLIARIPFSARQNVLQVGEELSPVGIFKVEELSSVSTWGRF